MRVDWSSLIRPDIPSPRHPRNDRSPALRKHCDEQVAVRSLTCHPLRCNDRPRLKLLRESMVRAPSVPDQSSLLGLGLGLGLDFKDSLVWISTLIDELDGHLPCSLLGLYAGLRTCESSSSSNTGLTSSVATLSLSASHSAT